jgi:hypothetical protein
MSGGFKLPDLSGIDMNKINGGGYGGGNNGKRSEPEYIMNNAKGRDIMPRMFLNTGMFWLGGFAAGGVYGLGEGWKTAAAPVLKVRVNSVLNAVSRRGSNLGNNLGLLGKFSEYIFYLI